MVILMVMIVKIKVVIVVIVMLIIIIEMVIIVMKSVTSEFAFDGIVHAMVDKYYIVEPYRIS